MLSEEEFKTNLIDSLNKISSGWIDGDREEGGGKKADIVNHNLKIAIEIKDSIRDEYSVDRNSKVRGYNLKVINGRLRDQIEDSNRKFRNYKNHRTILIFRTNLPASLIYESVQGIRAFSKSNDGSTSSPHGEWIMSKGLKYEGRKEKHQRIEVGSFLIFNEDGHYHFRDKYGLKSRIIEIEEIKKIFGLEFENIDEEV